MFNKIRFDKKSKLNQTIYVDRELYQNITFDVQCIKAGNMIAVQNAFTLATRWESFIYTHYVILQYSICVCSFGYKGVTYCVGSTLKPRTAHRVLSTLEG